MRAGRNTSATLSCPLLMKHVLMPVSVLGKVKQEGLRGLQ